MANVQCAYSALSTLCVMMQLLQQPSGVGAIFIFILQVNKLRYRESKYLY